MEKKEYKYVGKYLPRKDARQIVTGEAVFLDDHEVSKMLYAKIMPSPYAHARIKSIDTSKAEALPGVAAVVTYKNLPDFAKKWLRGAPPTKQMLSDKLLFAGDAVAFVAAESVDICKEAIRLIDVEYEVLCAATTLEEALDERAEKLYDDDRFEGNSVSFAYDEEHYGETFLHAVKRGDVDKAFEECDYIGSGVCKFETFTAPLAPEPPGVICTYDSVNDRYQLLWTGQSTKPKYVEAHLVPPGVVWEAKSFNVGGSYGNKQSHIPQTYCVSVLSKITGRPVKFMFSKEEQFMIHEMRVGSRMDMKFGMKDGVVHAVKGTWYLTPGMLLATSFCLIGVGLGEMQIALGKCKNWDVQTALVVTNRIPSGTVRGYGGQELKAAMMPIVARAMREANLEPVEFYKKNFVGLGDGYFWRDSNWWECLVDYKDCMDATAKRFNWYEKWKGWLKPTSINGSKRIGVGVSIHGNGDVGEDNSEAMVHIKPNGTITVQVQINESGMGTRSACAKIAAEEMNTPYEKVFISPSDSYLNPEEFGLAGSRGTLTVLTAVARACEDAKRQLFAIAAPMLRVSPEELVIEDGFVYVESQPERRLPWIKIMGFGYSIVGMGRWKANYASPNFCINFVEVEVDTDTGEAKILNLCTGTDVGQIIDEKAVEMQLQGGIGAAAIDTGILEETVLDKYTGRIMTNNLIDYKWRPFNEFPNMDTVILESRPNISKYKAVGVGEISGAAGAAAITMAISNAIGIDFIEYPATPTAILKALGKL